MALATSYNVSGDREALTNVLTILEPEDCPKTSSFAKTTKVTNTFQTWQADTLANVDFAGVLEGQDVNAFNNEAANRARFGNYIQKFWRPWMVSDLQEALSALQTASVPEVLLEFEGLKYKAKN